MKSACVVTSCTWSDDSWMTFMAYTGVWNNPARQSMAYLHVGLTRLLRLL